MLLFVVVCERKRGGDEEGKKKNVRGKERDKDRQNERTVTGCY